jgi:hypothetical protein
MREKYYKPWKEELAKPDESGRRGGKGAPIIDMYAVSAFGNKFAVFRQDFRFSLVKGLNLPRPQAHAHASYRRDIAPESWWCWDATNQSGKDRLELIANIIKKELFRLKLISGSCYAFLGIPADAFADVSIPAGVETPPELRSPISGSDHGYETASDAQSSDTSPDSSFGTEDSDDDYEPGPDDEDSEIGD